MYPYRRVSYIEVAHDGEWKWLGSRTPRHLVSRQQADRRPVEAAAG